MSGDTLRRVAHWTWYDESAGSSMARAVLAPFAGAFGAVVARRNANYGARLADGLLPKAAMPALSVGNLTVGGTGKTPVSSWFAGQLHRRGARPALVLRGYGDDEWRVHRLLTPDVPVVVNADRVAALAQASLEGCDCAVLDDAFQHRRARRISDVVLVAADRWPAAVRLLPAGPFREPLSSLRRATAVVITVKAATASDIVRLRDVLERVAPEVPVATVRLVPSTIRSVTSASAHDDGGERAVPAEHGLGWLSGRRFLLVSAIADPAAFEAQVRDAGGRPTSHQQYPDHHAFSASDVAGMLQDAGADGDVLCTLKDAVKLAPLWPRAGARLWYVSQTLVVDTGAEVLERECDRVLAARTTTVPTAG
jgi:tetraacyldisaccharide 4'-kinase